MFKATVSTVTILVCLLSGCQIQVSAPGDPEAVAGIFTPDGDTIIRDRGVSTERVTNCGGSTETIVLHPSMSVITGYSIEWEVKGTAGVGARIGGGVIPGGVDLSAALEGQYASQFSQNIERRAYWDLPAAPNTQAEFAIDWREVWQPGYIDVQLGDQSVVRVNIRVRTDIQSEIVGQQVFSCNDARATLLPSTITVSTIPATVTEITSTPFISTRQPVITQSNDASSSNCTTPANDFDAASHPASPPPNGCYLIVEWWVPPNPTPCGIIVTASVPALPSNAIGTWWFVRSNRPSSHIQEYRAKSPQCTVQDLR